MAETLVPLNDILVHPAYRDALQSAVLSTNVEIMTYQGGELFTYEGKKDRSVVKIVLPDGRPVFLKRHYTVSEECPLCSVFLRRRKTAAEKERAAIELFMSRGLPTAKIVAEGESFTMTEEMEGSVSLEVYVAERFKPPLDGAAVEEKRRIIRELALLTRKMHKASLSHKDYYLGHIFIRPSDLSLYVLDLQRVDGRLRWGDRWAVKDIAALDFLALPQYVTSADRMRFFTVYWGSGRLDAAAKRFITKVLGKRARIARHTRSGVAGI